MIIQFSLQELMVFLICLLGVIIGILIIPILWNVVISTSKLRKFLIFNEKAIQETMDTIPELSENLRSISADVKGSSELLKASLTNIVEDVESFANTTKSKIKSFNKKSSNLNLVDYLQSFETVLQIIYRIFSTKK